MSRVILHSDANSFYASVEICYQPELRNKPVAVCGDPTERHGIVLTKNPIAKKYGIQTGTPSGRRSNAARSSSYFPLIIRCTFGSAGICGKST